MPFLLRVIVTFASAIVAIVLFSFGLAAMAVISLVLLVVFSVAGARFQRVSRTVVREAAQVKPDGVVIEGEYRVIEVDKTHLS